MLKRTTITLSLLAGLGTSTPAFGSEIPSALAQPGTPALSAPQLKPMKRFISDGTILVDEISKMQITPIAGWEVIENPAGLTYIVQEPAMTQVKDRMKYKRNVTVARFEHGRPVDEISLEGLKTQLQNSFAKNPSIKDPQFLEHKFFNFRGENDGLVLYSAMMLGEFQMMQMHVLLSGSAHHFLLSFTDVAERFTKDEAMFQKAWAMMTTLSIEGTAPVREPEWLPYAKIGGGVFGALLLLLLLRRLFSRKRIDYAEEANSVYADDWSGQGADDGLAFTQSGVWSLGTSTLPRQVDTQRGKTAVSRLRGTRMPASQPRSSYRPSSAISEFF